MAVGACPFRQSNRTPCCSPGGDLRSAAEKVPAGGSHVRGGRTTILPDLNDDFPVGTRVAGIEPWVEASTPGFDALAEAIRIAAERGS